MSATDWACLPAGFDVARRGNQLYLVLRADVGGLVLSGMTTPVALMSHARAERASAVEKTTAVAQALKDMPAERAVSLLVRWWKEHKVECGRQGLPESYNRDLQARCRGNDLEPLGSLPGLLAKWRSDRAREIEQEKIARRIAGAVQIQDYDKLFPAASRPRKLTAILGPTNSGKTHLALQRLSEARSGYFCGPLRLLSLEVYERLNREFETPCSLITGEDRRIMDGAGHVSCTVEMIDPTRRVDVVVVDEVQMIGDRQRGWAWTQAIACANADEVILLGSPQIRRVLEQFAKKLGLAIEIQELKRLSPLTVAERPLGRSPRTALGEVRRGDCLVVFTRRDCIALRDDLMQLGHEVACVYGALSPEARQAEAQRFASGAAGVIVATDAIGLGLNLRGLQRVVLVASQKFNGVTRHDVPVDLVRQIAGRAGRFGRTDEDAGVAMGLTQDEHDLVRRALSAKPEDIELDALPVAPSGEVLRKLQQVTGETRLEVLLRLFVEHCTGGGYKAQLPGDAMERAYAVDGFNLPVETRFMLTQVPVSGRSEDVQSLWLGWCLAVEERQRVSLDFIDEPVQRMSLEDAERNLQLLAGYGWLGMRMPELFFAEAECRKLMRELSALVSSKLRSRSRLGHGAAISRKGLPSWYWQRRVLDIGEFEEWA